jgi:hypothetical protein
MCSSSVVSCRFGSAAVGPFLTVAFATVLALPVLMLTEALAVLWGLLSDMRQFYIVEKGSVALPPVLSEAL